MRLPGSQAIKVKRRPMKREEQILKDGEEMRESDGIHSLWGEWRKGISKRGLGRNRGVQSGGRGRKKKQNLTHV